MEMKLLYVCIFINKCFENKHSYLRTDLINKDKSDNMSIEKFKLSCKWSFTF